MSELIQVLCTLPNAGDEINGVKFSAHPKGKVSEPVECEVADSFLAIPGYEIAQDADVSSPPAVAKPVEPVAPVVEAPVVEAPVVTEEAPVVESTAEEPAAETTETAPAETTAATSKPRVKRQAAE